MATSPSFARQMTSATDSLQFLLTLPPAISRDFLRLCNHPHPQWFACSDSAGPPLGSGGGTANLLVEAWRGTARKDESFSEWLWASRKLMLHSGGMSRRLPAYAPLGKLLMPIPVFRWARGQRLDQTLLDLALPEYSRVLSAAGPRSVAMLVSGDTLIRVGKDLPQLPDVDVLGLGMWGTPEHAKDFGVFFTPRDNPREVAFFLQKPSPTKIREFDDTHLFMFDTGIWLLSERAVNVLLQRCGWAEKDSAFKNGRPANYEFYSGFGLALGKTPAVADPLIASLTCAVIPLPDAEFYHFGTSAQMIESVSALQNLVLDETQPGLAGVRRHPDQYLQNARFKLPLRREENHTLWVENSIVPESWQIAHEHVLTGVPENKWALTLEPGVCLDFVPLGESAYAIRAYGFRDTFSGALASASWFGQSVGEWLEKRGLSLADVGVPPSEDIQNCPLFPVLEEVKLAPEFITWLFASVPKANAEFTTLWRATRRVSAQQLLVETNLSRAFKSRAELRRECLAPMMHNNAWSVFFHLDLETTATEFAATKLQLPELAFSNKHEPMTAVRDQMFRAAVLRRRGQSGWEQHEANAFARLRELIVHEAQIQPAAPQRNVLEDQIVWARSPARLDLAGGWTDTPPYCIEFGGKVVNLAVDLNGQPPVQVFAKLSEKPELVIRSIDLGVEDRVTTYAELETFAQPGSAFALAKAAFALAGFLPRFQVDKKFDSLEKQLRAFGGGIELSLLAAVPKGSGLGTSSILSATVLAALNDLCGLNWDRTVIYSRTLALEQLLTTGGGWQDQAGGLFRGVKLIETLPGLSQKPTLRWLPEQLFSHGYANRTALLYYTGVTRLAKNILAEIVRGIFLNSPSHLDLIAQIGNNAESAAAAIQKCDYDLLAAAIRERWDLTQRLDSGTNPPAIQEMLAGIGDYLAAAKLLGAGGGGYLFMMAKDETAAAHIRRQLTESPPNARARFVDFTLSESGLQVTRS